MSPTEAGGTVGGLEAAHRARAALSLAVILLQMVLSGWRARPVHGSFPVMSTTPNPYRGFRFPAAIINEAVWLYNCFSLNLREIEVILAAQGIEVSYETIREWGQRLDREFATTLKSPRPRPGDKWLQDEVFIRIRVKQHYLWRAIDQNGVVLDVLVQNRRNKKAAKRFFRKLLIGLRYAPRVIVTDKLKSYAASKEGSEDRRRTPTKPISEQSLRSLASADPAARTAHETVQVR